MSSRFRVAAALLVALLFGCTTRAEYVVRDDALAAARTESPPSEGSRVVPATRVRDGQRVVLRADAIVMESPSDRPGWSRVRARAASPMVTAGSVLTWIGSGISLAASAIFFFRPVASEGTDVFHLASGVVAGLAEPIMISGTVLWIVGAVRPAQEVRCAGVTLVGPQFEARPDGSRTASLRFRF